MCLRRLSRECVEGRRLAMCLRRLSRECMEGVKLDELTSLDAQRLHAEYNSSRSVSSLSEELLLQLTEDVGMEV